MGGLREHLQKAEVEYIATHGGGYPETFKWDEDIEAHMKRIGFRIKDRLPDIYDCGMGVVVFTTSKISVDLKSGFIYKNTPRNEENARQKAHEFLKQFRDRREP